MSTGRGPGRWTEHTVAAEEAGRTVDELLTGVMGVSRRALQRLTRAQGVLLNRRPAFLGRRTRAGDVVAVRAAPDEEPGLEPVPMELRVVHEDAHLLVLDKPPGLLVHPVAPAHTRTLAHGVAHHLLAAGLRTRVRPVHRIDRDTSGLVMFAKSAAVHARLDAQIRDRSLRRTYLALVEGGPEADEGVVDAPIGRHPRRPELRAVRPGGDAARTGYRVLRRLRGTSLVELRLDAGRTHQIRVHMAHLGHPVVADRAYGGTDAGSGMRRPALHAWRLALAHPADGRELSLEAPLPADLVGALERLGAEPGAYGPLVPHESP